MLKGYMVPQSADGLSSLVPPPPWHYSSDCLVVEYWADPDAMAALLPPGLTLDKRTEGRGFFWFLDWQFTAQNDEITDPARYQYREAFVLIDAMFGEQPTGYCPYIFVDNDSAIARGWIQGFPKKLGSIFQTRTFAAPSAAAAPLAKGSRFGASVSAHGERIATARVQLEGKAGDPSKIFDRPTTIRRYFPQLVKDQQDKPAVNELTLSLVDDPRIVDVWTGTAELSIPEVRGEDLHKIAPVRVGRGFRLGLAYSVSDLKVLKNYVG